MKFRLDIGDYYYEIKIIKKIYLPNSTIIIDFINRYGSIYYSADRTINNNIISWQDRDEEIFHEELIIYCNRLVKNKAFI